MKDLLWLRTVPIGSADRGPRSHRDTPADELAAEGVRRPITRSAGRATPLSQAALIRHERQVADVCRRVAMASVAPAVAMHPMRARAAGRRRRRSQDARRERAAYLHRSPLPGRATASRPVAQDGGG